MKLHLLMIYLIMQLKENIQQLRKLFNLLFWQKYKHLYLLIFRKDIVKVEFL